MPITSEYSLSFGGAQIWSQSRNAWREDVMPKSMEILTFAWAYERMRRKKKNHIDVVEAGNERHVSLNCILWTVAVCLLHKSRIFFSLDLTDAASISIYYLHVKLCIFTISNPLHALSNRTWCSVFPQLFKVCRLTSQWGPTCNKIKLRRLQSSMMFTLGLNLSFSLRFFMGSSAAKQTTAHFNAMKWMWIHDVNVKEPWQPRMWWKRKNPTLHLCMTLCI